MILGRINIAETARWAPQRAGDEAYRLFCRPSLSPHRSANQDVLLGRSRVHLKRARWFSVEASVGPIQAYAYEPDCDVPVGSVLLAHGWTSEASFMAAFIEPLRRKGFRVVAFDFPAHGHSHQPFANLMDCAHAFHAVASTAGPFDAVIAHSIGGLVALMVADGAPPLAGSVRPDRYVLIATPNRLRSVAQDFAGHYGLTRAAQRSFERHLERVGHRSIDSVVAADFLAASGRAALVVHARDDTQVPFADAEAIVAGCAQASFHPVDGLGHAGVIFAPPVVRAVRDFLMP